MPLAELKARLPAKLMPLVEEFREKLERLSADQGGRLVLEKGDDPKDLRRARRVRFPFRGEEGAVSFYLEKPRGRRAKAAVPASTGRKRGRPRKVSG